MNDHGLNEAFRALAREGIEGAPPRVEATLRREFRRRKRSKAAWRAIGIGLPIAAALAVVVFSAPQTVAPPSPRVSHVAPPPMAWVKGGAGVSVCASPCRDERPKPRRSPSAVTVADKATPFYPLPYGGDSLGQEPHLVVRLEMQRSAMRLVGIAVPEERAREPIQADVLLGADGLARAVRFLD